MCIAIKEGIADQKTREGAPLAQRLQKQLDEGRGLHSLVAERPENVQTILTVQESSASDSHETMQDKTVQEEYFDDLPGEPLPHGLTSKARLEELEFMRSWHVWQVVSRSEAWKKTGKAPLRGRWVDTNKADSVNPNVRCRWVACDIAKWRDDAMFAATPPLEALRFLMSDLATRRRNGTRQKGQRKAMFIDVRKAHLHAYVDREIFVDLPPEAAQEGKCAKLVRCLYGTRDAPSRWEAL